MEAGALAARAAVPTSIAASSGAHQAPTLRSSRINGARLPCIVSAPSSKSSVRRWRQWTLSVRSESKSDPPLYIGYDPKKTVFPAEACDELGEEFCNAEGLGEEVNPHTPPAESSTEEQPTTIFGRMFKAEQNREYLEYNSEKTVFPGEACDELGGEFCEPDFLKDVGPESRPSA